MRKIPLSRLDLLEILIKKTVFTIICLKKTKFYLNSIIFIKKIFM